MALQKTYNFKGIDFNYWKIISSTSNALSNTMSVTIALYYNQQSRLNSTDNLFETRQYVFNGTDLKRSDIYPLIKDMYTNDTVDQTDVEHSSTKFFSDALDV